MTPPWTRVLPCIAHAACLAALPGCDPHDAGPEPTDADAETDGDVVTDVGTDADAGVDGTTDTVDLI